MGEPLPRPDAPRWARPAPAGMNYAIEVYKNNSLVETYALGGAGVAPGAGQAAWLFGRHPSCDFVLDHGSVSRQHAWVGWDDFLSSEPPGKGL